MGELVLEGKAGALVTVFGLFIGVERGGAKTECDENFSVAHLSIFLIY